MDYIYKEKKESRQNDYMTEDDSKEMLRRIKVVKELGLGIFDYDDTKSEDLDEFEDELYMEYICQNKEIPQEKLEKLRELQKQENK